MTAVYGSVVDIELLLLVLALPMQFLEMDRKALLLDCWAPISGCFAHLLALFSRMGRMVLELALAMNEGRAEGSSLASECYWSLPRSYRHYRSQCLQQWLRSQWTGDSEAVCTDCNHYSSPSSSVSPSQVASPFSVFSPATLAAGHLVVVCCQTAQD